MGPCCQNSQNTDQTRGLKNQDMQILDKKDEVTHDKNMPA